MHLKIFQSRHLSCRQNDGGEGGGVRVPWMETLTLRERVGLHDVEKTLHQLEQDPYWPGFIMGHCFINSCRHIAEVQLSRGWESPRLRILPEFGGHREQQQQRREGGGPHPDWTTNWGRRDQLEGCGVGYYCTIV